MRSLLVTFVPSSMYHVNAAVAAVSVVIRNAADSESEWLLLWHGIDSQLELEPH